MNGIASKEIFCLQSLWVIQPRHGPLSGDLIFEILLKPGCKPSDIPKLLEPVAFSYIIKKTT